MKKGYPNNMGKIINEFCKWYETDEHSRKAALYEKELTAKKLKNFSDEEFVVFFTEFVNEGGGIQSQGQRNGGLKETIKNKKKEFRKFLLEPFDSDFVVDDWLGLCSDFKGFGQGISTIYLNRVNKDKYCIVNEKSIKAYRKFGFEIKSSSLKGKYKKLREAENDLIDSFPEVTDFYMADALSHFLIGTEGGKNLLGSKESKQTEKGDSNMRRQLNNILYGPPGTGKTFNAVNHAVAIIERKEISQIKDEKREDVKNRFDELVKSGVIAFTTFHQSYGYEDFVEGLKVESEDNQLVYDVKPGVFKALCEKALESGNGSLTQLNNAIEALKESLQEEQVELETSAQGKKFSLTYKGRSAFYAKPIAGEYENPVSIEAIKKLYINPDIKSGSEGVHFKIYTLPVIKYLKDTYGLKDYQKKEVNNSPHVLIIDEINRGNISKIFGELITLIEADKREGSKEALSVILPYSKKKFTVPNNIHIIGTMNTADASIAKLDVALRRRFDFIEMPPKPSLLQDITVAGIDLKKMLESINQRIELLYDREHTIGHSFFMGLSDNPTIGGLAEVFEKNIIPLLQEYFFDDWERIHWVLDTLKEDESAHFVKKHLNSDDELKKLMGEKWLDGNRAADSSLWTLNMGVLKKPEAYIGIYPPEAE